ncbi:MAG: hypothetical protein ABIQ93_16440, partial [Saprospiraceae bacterium]
ALVMQWLFGVGREAEDGNAPQPVLPNIGDQLEWQHFPDTGQGAFIGINYQAPGPGISGYQTAYAAFNYKGNSYYELPYEDVVSFIENNAVSPLDIPEMQNRIQRNQGVFFFWGSRPTTEISYRFILFPCTIVEDNLNKFIYTGPFEGLEWTATRQFTPTGWQPPTIKIAPGNPAVDSQIIWKRGIRTFLESLPGAPYALRIGVPDNWVL